jgi:hypothetical protein
MNDRNAFLQGQGSPIKDDEPPPTQGWRGEKSVNDQMSRKDQRLPIPETKAQAEIISGEAYIESRGLQSPTDASDDRPAASATIKKSTGDEHPDSVHDLNESRDSPGGQSAGAPYPNPHHGEKKDPQFGTAMGHGGQSEIAYHGPGHLGDQIVDDGEVRLRKGTVDSPEQDVERSPYSVTSARIGPPDPGRKADDQPKRRKCPNRDHRARERWSGKLGCRRPRGGKPEDLDSDPLVGGDAGPATAQQGRRR